MLGIYGIAPSDYTPVYVNYNDGFSALGDSNVDAAIVNSAPPIPGIKELAIRKSIRLLPVSDDKRKAFLEKYAYYRAGILKKSVYDTAQDVVTLGTSNIIIARKDLDTGLVYNMVKAVCENLDTLRAAHPSARVVDIKDGTAGGVALHPGAARYFREQGILK
ncbi:MAG: TAXI family TRAP transporter solute-binding subunit [Burkholderiales bacterium]|nr:TAXI family TRAP transporter solute-binding subunit [Burkholderiales bacterium]